MQSSSHSGNLSISTLTQISVTFNLLVEMTQQRICYLKNPKREEPHVKLMIIDLVNYLVSLLSQSDRRAFINELHEM